MELTWIDPEHGSRQCSDGGGVCHIHGKQCVVLDIFQNLLKQSSSTSSSNNSSYQYYLLTHAVNCQKVNYSTTFSLFDELIQRVIAALKGNYHLFYDTRQLVLDHRNFRLNT